MGKDTIKRNFDVLVKKNLSINGVFTTGISFSKENDAYIDPESQYAKDLFCKRLIAYKCAQGEISKTAFEAYATHEISTVAPGCIKILSVASSSRLCFELVSQNKNGVAIQIHNPFNRTSVGVTPMSPRFLLEGEAEENSDATLTIPPVPFLEKGLQIFSNGKEPIAINGAKPQMDIYYECNDKTEVFIECKCHEVFDGNNIGYPVGKTLETYNKHPTDLVNNIEKIKAKFVEIKKEKDKNPNIEFPYVQFVKHIYGIIGNRQSQSDFKNKTLLYVFFVPEISADSCLGNMVSTLVMQIGIAADIVKPLLEKNGIRFGYSFVKITPNWAITLISDSSTSN